MTQEQHYTASDKSQTEIFGTQTISRREKNKWQPIGEQGTYMLIDKTELALDLSYQRESSSRNRILKIAREFDWQAFGALSVSMRKDGFFVTDGGHRLRACELRDDISKVPCLVFDNEGVADEANAFITQNTMKTNVSPYHKFRAKLVARDDIAIRVQKILDAKKYRFVQTAKTGRTTSAVAAIVDAATRDISAFSVAFDLCVDIADGEPIPASVFRGVFYLITHGCEEVATTTYRKKLIFEGIDKLSREIYRNKHLHSSGGVRIEAQTILMVVNKGRRTRRLELHDEECES